MCNCSEPSKIFKNDYSCLHECRHFYNILFCRYATPRKHIVFSRLVLNSYNNVTDLQILTIIERYGDTMNTNMCNYTEKDILGDALSSAGV